MLGSRAALLRGPARAGSTRSLTQTLLAQRHRRIRSAHALLAPSASRQFSLWPSSKPQPAPASPADVPAPETAVPEQAVTASPVIDAPSPDLTAGLLQESATPGAAVSEAVDLAVNGASAIPPLQLGDCAAAGLTKLGLISFPAGLAVSFLEFINVSTGLSWFSTIILGTVATRALLFPLGIIQQRNTGKLAPFQPKLLALKEKMTEAGKTEDKVALQRVIIQQRNIYKQAGVNLPAMLALPFAQIPVTIGMFFGIRRLMESNLPQVHASGIADIIPAWADLSVPDPYYIVPVAGTVLMNVAIVAFSKDQAATSDRKTVGLTMLFFRGMSVIFLPVSMTLALGLNISIITGSVLLAAQTYILRKPAVRRALSIPALPKRNKRQTTPTLKESVGFAKEWFINKKEEAERKALRGQNVKKW
ncbi:hypothetical protein PENSPDRAFT_688814 [Peniophora sp. CONT]|nr:hypothetical protein PENSPDRAFT_688814 [Peniophora sp. CONT]